MNVVLSQPFRARTWRETAYALASLPVGVFWAVALGFCYLTGLGSLVGIPLIALGLVLARIGGRQERRFLGWATGEPVEAPPQPRIPEEGTWWDRWKPVFLDVARLKESGYLFLHLPMGALLFGVTVATWAVAVGGLTSPLQAAAGIDDTGPLETLGWFVAGAAMLFAAPWIVRGAVHLQWLLAQGLLGASRKEIEREREAAVQTASRDRRQLERDLHDGAQARLTALAVELGRARERLESGDSPEEAAQLVRAAHEQAKRAVVEVRDLARGIHPAILTDRGLDAALSSLAASSPARVMIDADPGLRAPDAVEGAAYFVAAEALTNIAKHSGAENAYVSVRRRDDRLVVEVRDDGVGGAEARPGSGLAGLAERVRALGGQFEVQSPRGGPTVVTAELPCG